MKIIHFRERRAEIEDRAIPGHWESELRGTRSHIVNSVEPRFAFSRARKGLKKLGNPANEPGRSLHFGFLSNVFAARFIVRINRVG